MNEAKSTFPLVKQLDEEACALLSMGRYELGTLPPTPPAEGLSGRPLETFGCRFFV